MPLRGQLGIGGDEEVRSVNRLPEQAGHPVSLRDWYPVPDRDLRLPVVTAHRAVPPQTRPELAVTCSGCVAPLEVR